MIIYTLPESAKKVIEEYSHLPLGGKQIICPYFINPKTQRAGLRVLIGKGDPGEISREVKVHAQLKGIDLSKLSASEIRQFMMDNHIGIDCSGLVSHVYNFWLKQEGKNPLITYLKFKNNSWLQKLKRTLRPVEQIGANTLTNSDNTKPINNINEIRPGDFIRSKGLRKNSHHIMIVSEVTMIDNNVNEIEYIHSIKGYNEENGLRFGKIIISDSGTTLDKQVWTEIKDGRNWAYEGYMNQLEDNGVRRLKNINLSYITNEKTT